jgi:hypothetical protein
VSTGVTSLEDFGTVCGGFTGERTDFLFAATTKVSSHTLIAFGTVAVSVTIDTLSTAALFVALACDSVTSLACFAVGVFGTLDTDSFGLVADQRLGTTFGSSTGHAFVGLGVTDGSTATVSSLAATCDTGVAGVTDTTGRTVAVTLTTDTLFFRCVTNTSGRTGEGATVTVLTTTAGVGLGVTLRTLITEGRAITSGTVAVRGTLNTDAFGGLASAFGAVGLTVTVIAGATLVSTDVVDTGCVVVAIAGSATT